MSQTVKIRLGYSCYLSARLPENIRSMPVRSGMEWGYHELTKSYRNGVEVSLEAVVYFQEGKPASETMTIWEVLLRLQGHRQVRKGI